MSASQQQKIMMLFSIGPVQEFIAQARRTRDLWFGSHLLSELSWAGAMAFQELGGKVVYPVLATNVGLDQGSAPNRILGIIGADVDPQRIAFNVRHAMSGVWMEHVKQARAQVKGLIKENTWDRQVADLIEYYAVWRRYDVDASSYAQTLAQVEHDMMARKTLRDFRQNEPGVLYGEVKSTLDGGRESVWLTPRHDVEAAKQQQQLLRLGVKKNEQLDAISVVKRIKTALSDQHTFPSVCEMAFRPFKQSLKEDSATSELAHAYQRQVNVYIKDKLSAGSMLNEPLDARLFYVRRVEEYIDEYTKGTLPEKVQWVQQIIQWLEELYRRIPEPTPYYAFIVADGDRMGHMLRSIQNDEQHITFSEKLSAFSAQAQQIIADCEGQLIYGGGDDVMAYVPVHTCLQAAERLRQAFQGKVSSNTTGQSATLSVGMVIVHMLEPLEEVRQWAQAAEKHAKQQRNSLAIHVHKRGGGDQLQMSLSFNHDPIGTLIGLLIDFRQGYFSTQLAYELRNLYITYRQLAKSSSWLNEDSVLHEVLYDEIRRLAIKKKPTLMSEELHQAFRTKLLGLFNGQGESSIVLLDPLLRLQQLTEQLILTIQLEEVRTAHEDIHPSPTP
ncbi:type III-B CRISPR-associated protein Cas10/Cmr2 [Paenibacillus sp. WLX2291]|uniref:type III-B CRISPR-associated protein Cas10/Cmr2 n=1 Tax=Paenibacillus sp. WLX2291 TaxID=3296934 RepID=UPI003983EAA5